MARTVGAKNKPKFSGDDEGLDLDNTEIEIQEDKPKKETRGRPAGGKQSVDKEIISDKLNTLCEGIAFLMGLEYNFNSADFRKESSALSNIAKQYPPVAKVLDLFDPLLIVFGIFSKFKAMKKKNKKEDKSQQPVQNVSRETYEQNSSNGLSLIKMG